MFRILLTSFPPCRYIPAKVLAAKKGVLVINFFHPLSAPSVTQRVVEDVYAKRFVTAPGATWRIARRIAA
jgi:hypothetical protein